ncbi:HNH endonuclease family protein [Corynebacterium sp. ES2775-CONJ]|uniref:HNH endonuclease family protein n=1 Tax=Corynebacterium sp. ES2775-CONJ TaxID=2974029 RepID=UPI0021686568|nr:HNH endonuclease family protein [Corynebacterium sp. ES2775-CONJ]MCS4489848.1 HNH endonuclease family protein [Corynebacterium sp. ES2775-CONJ]
MRPFRSTTQDEYRIPVIPLILTLVTLMLLGEYFPNPQRSHFDFDSIRVVSRRTHILGYSREEFGSGWATIPGHPCSIREEIIYSQLLESPSDIPRESGSFCPTAPATVPLTGPDPYSTATLSTAADGSGRAIEVDHIFPLRAAWDMGAFRWETSQRRAFANDPDNLVAVSQEENQRKSDLLPSRYLPSNIHRRCWYVTRLARIAVKYDLALTKRDVSIMRRQCLFE